VEYSEITAFANEASVQFSLFMRTSGSQLDTTALVVAVFAQTLRVELSIFVFTLSDLADFLPVGSLLNYNAWNLIFLFTYLLNLAYLFITLTFGLRLIDSFFLIFDGRFQDIMGLEFFLQGLEKLKLKRLRS